MVGGYPIQGLMWGILWPGLDGGRYPIPGGWGYPGQVWIVGGTQGTPLGQVWMVGGYLIPGVGVPWPGLDGGGGTWGNPPYPPTRQSSIASTCYAGGGMPLAFTQEDFLVFLFSRIHSFRFFDARKKNKCRRITSFGPNFSQMFSQINKVGLRPWRIFDRSW